MNIGIIGSGISGVTCARLLHDHHTFTLYESRDRPGGHIHTVDVQVGETTYPVDTGFIVFNNRTYPRFQEILEDLDVEYQPTEMSFSVRCENSGLEYNGHSINSLFAQRSNLFSARFHRLWIDILRFNRDAHKWLQHSKENLTLGEFIKKKSYSDWFVDKYLLPMGAAIWSSSLEEVSRFPARHMFRFFDHHGLLQIRNRPQWYSFPRGSRSYLRALISPWKDRLRTNTPVRSVHRGNDKVTLKTDGNTIKHDAVVFATHSDQALDILENPTREEQKILGAISYHKNEAYLHTDSSILPSRKTARASWNVYIPGSNHPRPVVTYYMNILQNFKCEQDICVSLNAGEYINSDSIIDRFTYYHPGYSSESDRARSRWEEINGNNNTFYAGAYWLDGFHEDGVQSAYRVVNSLDASLTNE
ncbi:MAG: NAD(P)/FAD-dependent oxidoreductase [bacterium]